MEEFFATLLGAAIGVPAGSLVQFLAQAFIDRGREARQRASLLKEVEYNLLILRSLREEATKFRNAVNGRALGTYFGYLSFSDGLFVQTSELAKNGNLYRWFDVATISTIQKAAKFFSSGNEAWFNAEVKKLKEQFEANSERLNYEEAVKFANYLEGSLEAMERDLQAVTRSVATISR